MKKLMFLMMALMVAPAMAAVTFEVVDNADHTGSIWVTVSGADTVGGGNVYSLIAGIAIDVEVDGSADIIAVTGYKADDFPTTPAVSTAANPGYGIYMGTITFTGGNPEEIATAGTPVAPYDDPGSVHGDAFPGTFSDVLTLEFGCLYDVSVSADAPVLVTKLCTIELSEEANLSIGGVKTGAGGNATRGGVVRLGGGASSAPDYGTPTLITGFDCYTGQPDFAEWVAVGKPESWCCPYQCRGDANGENELIDAFPWPPWETWAPVGPPDLTLFIAAYRKALGDPAEDLATDFDHSSELIDAFPWPPWETWARTGPDDLAVFVVYYRDELSTVPVCGSPVLTSCP